MIKRSFDCIVSGLGIIILSPILFLTAIGIKLDSTGPIFYRQLRVGKNNHDFCIFKFRTMHIGADKLGLITVGGRDPRVTRLGYWLRKFKIDEIPQLFNVFAGEMSIVGPRPEVRKFVDLYNSEQLHVLDVRPGITSLASVKYRNENEILEQAVNANEFYIRKVMPDKLAIDLEYIQNQNFWYDIKLIFKTLKVVLIK